MERLCAFLTGFLLWLGLFCTQRSVLARARCETGPLLMEIERGPRPLWWRLFLAFGALSTSLPLVLAFASSMLRLGGTADPIGYFFCPLFVLLIPFPIRPVGITLEIRERGLVPVRSMLAPYAFWSEIRSCLWLKRSQRLTYSLGTMRVSIPVVIADSERFSSLLGQYLTVFGEDFKLLCAGPKGRPLSDAELAAQKAVIRGRRFQFSLRTLLFFTLIVAAASSWYAVHREYRGMQRAALDALAKFQPAHHPNDEIMFLMLTSNKQQFTDREVALMKAFPSVDNLDLSFTSVTDAAIPDLVSMTWLRSISLRGSKITPEGMERLRKAMPNTKIEDK
jgi:hypothetical protein